MAQKICKQAGEEAHPFAAAVNALVLTAGTAESMTMPADYNYARVKVSTGTAYYSATGTAVAPAADVTDGTASALLISGETYNWPAGTAISFVNSANSVVTFELYRWGPAV